MGEKELGCLILGKQWKVILLNEILLSYDVKMRCVFFKKKSFMFIGHTEHLNEIDCNHFVNGNVIWKL